VKMPGLDGLETLKKIKSSHPESFIVIQTAHANLQDAITAIKEGAFDYVLKPQDIEKVESLIKLYAISKK
ncbi:MAG: response regulator, partial [Elusimicrobiales bacterium]|nr:response regulator [Elusimicrobiales bacterium]